jgi:hypothetical protein
MREQVTISARHARFIRAKAARDAINDEATRLSETLRKFPTGPTGLTPDAVKASPEYRAAKQAYDSAFAALRCFNASFIRTFAREIEAERAARRAAR